VLDTVTLNEVAPILDANISREADLMTDEHRVYRGLGWNFAAHSAVSHTKGQYAVPGTPNCTPTPSKAISASSSAG
jgi:hypothetical protein